MFGSNFCIIGGLVNKFGILLSNVVMPPAFCVLCLGLCAGFAWISHAARSKPRFSLLHHLALVIVSPISALEDFTLVAGFFFRVVCTV